jgi:hypothetical protein
MTVSTNLDEQDGDTSSPANLVANPGVDGKISLREAVQALDNQPADYTVNFAAGLLGQTTTLSSPLPHLDAPHMTIDGDIAGNNTPGVTIAGTGDFGFFVEATDVRINALALNGFTLGVRISPTSNGQVFQGQTFTNLNITGSRGIELWSNWYDNDQWLGMQILGNTFATPAGGVGISAQLAQGDFISNLTVARNTMSFPSGPGAGNPFGINISSGGLPRSINDEIGTVLVADNTITGLSVAVRFAVGDLGANNNRMDHVTIAGNQIQMPTNYPNGVPSLGMMIQVGDSPDTQTPPFNYPSGNVMNDVSVLGNTITGPQTGIHVTTGFDGAVNNQITGLTIAGNHVNSVLSINGDAMGAVLLNGGGDNGTAGVRALSGNSLTNATVSYNTISMPSQRTYWADNEPAFGGIAVYGGGRGAQGNAVSGLTIDHNQIDSDPAAIAIVGGVGGQGWFAAQNTVAPVTITCNEISHAPTLDPNHPGIKGISLIGGVVEATGNSVASPLLSNNDVAGVLDDQSRLTNVGPGTSANTVGPPPVVTHVSPAQGPSNGGTTVTISGSDFTGGAPSCAVNNVAVSFGPNPATMSACSDTQISATSPTQGAASSPVDVVVTTAGGPSATSSADQFAYVALPPGAPTAVSATAGNAQAGLTWTAPASNGGSPITNYQVTPFIGATAQTPVLTGSTSTSFSVTGLTPGTTYTFTVAAINSVGKSASSAPSNPVTLRAGAAQSSPAAPPGGRSASQSSPNPPPLRKRRVLADGHLRAPKLIATGDLAGGGSVGTNVEPGAPPRGRDIPAQVPSFPTAIRAPNTNTARTTTTKALTAAAAFDLPQPGQSAGQAPPLGQAPIRRRARLGGLLSDYSAMSIAA